MFRKKSQNTMHILILQIIKIFKFKDKHQKTIILFHKQSQKSMHCLSGANKSLYLPDHIKKDPVTALWYAKVMSHIFF